MISFFPFTKIERTASSSFSFSTTITRLLSTIRDQSKKDGIVRPTFEVQNALDKMVCILTRDGKKAKAERIILQTLTILRRDTYKDPKFIFAKALENVEPLFELKNVRISGKTHLVPALITKERQQGIALRWIVETARKEKKTYKENKIPFSRILANQISDASKKRGQAFYKKINLHKTAEANRAFAHKRWW